MLNEMGFSEFRRHAAGGNLVPVYREVLADLLTPVSAFLKIGGRERLSFLLESVEGGSAWPAIPSSAAIPSCRSRSAAGGWRSLTIAPARARSGLARRRSRS